MLISFIHCIQVHNLVGCLQRKPCMTLGRRYDGYDEWRHAPQHSEDAHELLVPRS